jgi:hypothetical protein
MGKEPAKIPEIRAMREGHLERIIEIDNLFLAERRPDCWEGKIEMLGKKSPLPDSSSIFRCHGIEKRRHDQTRVQD